MVGIEQVRASNARIKSFDPGLVAVFVKVGGTSGIAESTLKNLCVFAVKPVIYIIGRNEKSANRIISELRDIESEGIYTYIKKDVSLLANVDDVCLEIKQKEKKINLLFLSCGVASMKSRNETSEGIDKKLATNYYSRMRFVINFLSRLEAAHPQLSRVISVLAPGTESVSFDKEDMGLQHKFSLAAAANHASIMTTFFFEQLANRHRTISFIHSYPGIVKTGFMKEQNILIRAAASTAATLFTPWIMPLGESGERHLYLSTNGRFPSRDGTAAMPATHKEGGPMKGTNGSFGSGAYVVGKDCRYRANEQVLIELRDRTVGILVLEHTMELFTSLEA